MGRPLKSVPYIDATLMKDQTIGAAGTEGSTVMTEPLRVDAFSSKTIYVKSDVNTSVEIKLGPNESNLCFLFSGTGVQTEDEPRSWNVNNIEACWRIVEHGVYMQVVLTNNSATSGTVSVWMSGE